jgi:hypothetical protein
LMYSNVINRYNKLLLLDKLLAALQFTCERGVRHP